MTDEQRKTVDSHVAAHDEDRRATAEALRAAIRSAEPESTESMKRGQPVYSANGPLVELKAFPRSVTLTFQTHLTATGRLAPGD